MKIFLLNKNYAKRKNSTSPLILGPDRSFFFNFFALFVSFYINILHIYFLIFNFLYLILSQALAELMAARERRVGAVDRVSRFAAALCAFQEPDERSAPGGSSKASSAGKKAASSSSVVSWRAPRAPSVEALLQQFVVKSDESIQLLLLKKLQKYNSS